MLKTTLNYFQRRKLKKYCKTLGEDDPDFYRDALTLLASGADIQNIILMIHAKAVIRVMRVMEEENEL